MNGELGIIISVLEEWPDCQSMHDYEREQLAGEILSRLDNNGLYVERQK